MNTESIKEEFENLSEKSSNGVISEESALQSKSRHSDRISEKISIKDDISDKSGNYYSEIKEVVILKKENKAVTEKKFKDQNKVSPPKKIETSFKKAIPTQSERNEVKYEHTIEIKGKNKLSPPREAKSNENIENINWKSKFY